MLFDAGHPKLVRFDNLEEWDGEGSRRVGQEVADIGIPDAGIAETITIL